MDEIFNKIIKEGLTPNAVYILYAYKSNVIPNKIVNSSIEVARLTSEEWLVNNQLTTKSIELLKELDVYFK